ncbi:MAG TPA: LysR family transcriptional regulator [Polyangiaceae bacterium]|nr:LysR family transcriptional regulator [Polyangiaceae bacterium]
MNINNVNLNLLVAFQALFEERSVTRAARRAGITQPAMSNTLAQLRALLDDPLFTRTGKGLLPTARATALADPIGRGLKLLDSALVEQRFDPARSDRLFTVAASDYVEFVLLPPLLAELARIAPRVRLRIRPWGSHSVPAELARGEFDSMIGFYDDVPARHRHTLLFSDEYVCVVRKGHPRVKHRLTLPRYLELSHVLVSTSNDSPGSVDRALAAQGLRRQVGLRVSHFLSVPMVVARTDYVAALDRRVAQAFSKALGLVLLKPPLALPVGKVGQVWHESVDADPGHRWLREVIASVSSKL